MLGIAVIDGRGTAVAFIAAYAIANNATMVYHDRDFENLANATRTLKQHCIVFASTA